jgi:alkylated DNA nucleotide flippase Atl1
VVGVGGPRQVGKVLAEFGGPVPWWRVVRADGAAPRGHEREAASHYRSESTPLRNGPAERVRVDMARAFWAPESAAPVR